MSCGAALERHVGPAESRRVVTVVFTDVVGSTALGERLDPESVREVMGRYFDLATAVMERHGGTVEKFIGDAVMAVFGLPAVHEDDALRAVRAAHELRARLAEHPAGEHLQLRTGVNTGMVVAGEASTRQRLVTGDAVNTAARLEQHAAPGEIVLGDATYRLVRGAVAVEAMPSIAAKGKSEPVRAYRLLSVDAAAEATLRRLDSPFVGRRRELERLVRTFEDAAADRRCALFTLLGPAGVGKSRLVLELSTRVAGEATVAQGRCLPYGEGITYWPIAEIVRGAAGILDSDDAPAAVAKLREIVATEADGDEISGLIAAAIGLAPGAVDRDDLFRAVRRFFETLARDRPLVVVFDDVHWAEPTLLDLIEHVVDWSRERAILVIVVARPELLDTRAGWGGGKLDAQVILLEALGPDDIEALAGSLLGGRLEPSVLERVEAAAEGNPLFVEQLLAMLVDDGVVIRDGDTWRSAADAPSLAVPPTIAALLAARLDRLPAQERQVAERASVVGRVFERGAITELTPVPERDGIPEHLRTLVRRELLRPDALSLDRDETYRFRHILIRDAAYEALPKRDRADLHARFATWLEATAAGRLAELEEIVGHHLDQAIRNRDELGLDDQDTSGLVTSAVDHLRSAGLRALERGDPAAAIRLQQRALDLSRRLGPPRLDDLFALAFAMTQLNHHTEALPILAEARAAAEAAGDPAAGQRALVMEVIARSSTDPSVTAADVERVADAALATLDPGAPTRALADAWVAKAYAALTMARWQDAATAAEKALDIALALGETAVIEYAAFWIANAYAWGPIPATEGLERLEPVVAVARTRRGRAMVESVQAALQGFAGDEAAAAEKMSAAQDALVDLGSLRLRSNLLSSSIVRASGDDARSIEMLEEGRANMARRGETGSRSTVEGLLGLAYARVGRNDDALAVTDASQAHSSIDDLASQAYWRAGRALALANMGRLDEAVTLAAEAVAIAAGTDQLNMQGDVLDVQGRVLRLAGRTADAAAAWAASRTSYGLKGNRLSLARLDREIGPAPTS